MTLGNTPSFPEEGKGSGSDLAGTAKARDTEAALTGSPGSAPVPQPQSLCTPTPTLSARHCPQHPPQHHFALTSAFPALTIAPAGRSYKGDFCQYWDRSPPRRRRAPAASAHTPVNSSRPQVLETRGWNPAAWPYPSPLGTPDPPALRTLGAPNPRGAWAAVTGGVPDAGALPGAATTQGRNRAGIRGTSEPATRGTRWPPRKRF